MSAASSNRSRAKWFPDLCTFTAVGMAISLLAAGPAAAQEGAYVKGRVIVATRAGVSAEALGKALSAHGGRASRIGGTDLHVVELPAQASEVAVKNLLNKHPLLKFAELDAILQPSGTANDPYFGSQWHLGKVNAPSAWDLSTGATVTIAILDSGVDASHPDLKSQLVPGWNFFHNNSDTSDMNGHGTAVAGAAGAVTNNGAGVASIAGGAKIMPLRITDANGAATGSMVAKALTYAADRGVRVANVSYEGVPGNSTVQTAAQYMKSKGGLVIVSAGNSGANLNLPAETTMIPVSATDSNDVKTSWSNFGNYVAVSAPGLNIYTTAKGGGYCQCWGTSFSSPITAGTVALMMAMRPDLPNTQIESLLYATAVDLGAAGRDAYYGFGRVNAAAAVEAARVALVADTQAPSVSIASPAGGSSVSGQVAVDVSAADNVGVVRVELRVNGKTYASDTASPYQFSWDSTQVANGSHVLTAVAYDAAGNAQTSSNATVWVGNAVAGDTTPPVVRFTAPAAGATISGGSVTVGLGATDNAGAAGIRSALYINGSLVASSTGSALTYKWNTKRVKPGTYTLQAVSTDASGNAGSSTIQVYKR